MKFRCQNCANKFSVNIIDNNVRKRVFCPECKSRKIRFVGAGYIKDYHYEIEIEEIKDDDNKWKTWNVTMKNTKIIGDIK